MTPLSMVPCEAQLAMELDVRSYLREALHLLETPLLDAVLLCLICSHISAAGHLHVGTTPVREIQLLPSHCLAQHAVMPISVSSTYQRDLVLTHAVYASFFEQRNCLRPFSCRDGTGTGVKLAQTKAKGGIPAILMLLQNHSYKLCNKQTAHPGEASNANVG